MATRITDESPATRVLPVAAQNRGQVASDGVATGASPAQEVTPWGSKPLLDKRDWIAGLQKGLSIIETFDYANPRLSAAQVGVRTGLTRTAARRHLLTLANLGYVTSDGKLFWLTPAVLRLGQSYIESARLPRLVQPYLQRVTAGTHETAFVSVLDGNDIVYIARSGSHAYMNTGYVIGARVQAQVTAAGLLLLALSNPQWLEHWLASQTLKPYTSHTITQIDVLRQHIAQIRAQHWSLSEQQLELGMRGIAVPLIDLRGDLVGALNVTMPMGKESAEHALQRVLPVLQETAKAMRNLI
jgi:IclR family transcriptional regulator, pca regulon regulatory protein